MRDFSPTLFASCVEPLADPVLFRTAYDAVPSYRREKTDRFRFLKDKRRALGAELLLRHAAREAGAADFPADLRLGEQGKPYLPGHEFHFNLSHSGDWVICAAAHCEVGCDVEQIASADFRVAKRFFTRSEYEQITAQETEETRNLMFYRYWTLKESFQKVTGLGMKLPMKAFEIQTIGEISVCQSVDDRQYFFSEYRELSGYCCALCTAGERPDPVLRTVDMKALLSETI